MSDLNKGHEPEQQDDDLSGLAELDGAEVDTSLDSAELNDLTALDGELDDLNADADPDIELQALLAMSDELNPDIDVAESEPDEQDLKPVAPEKPVLKEELKPEEWAGLIPEKLIRIVEAGLFAYGKPLSMDKLLNLFDDLADKPSRKCLRWVLQELGRQYQDRGIELVQVRSGFRFQTSQETAGFVQNLWDERPNKYSRATLETLSLIAYRQPITRGEIEDVRGVSVSSQIIKSLIEREWIRVVGHRDVPGRPALFATTKEFLDYFCLENLEQLPSLAEIRELDDLEPELELESQSDTQESSTGFDHLVENLKQPETEDMLLSMDAALADDLAETSEVNDQFEAMLAAQKQALESPDEQDQEAESADAQIEQDTGLMNDTSGQKDISESPGLLTEEEQMAIIQQKLAEQQALIDNREQDNHDTKEQVVGREQTDQ